MAARMKPLDDQQQAARDWFESLRTRICAEFEQIEREAGSDAAFEYIPWDRVEESLDGGFAHFPPRFFIQKRRWRFLNHFLMAALDRAFAFP